MRIDGHLHILHRENFLPELLEEMDALGLEKGLLLALPAAQWKFKGGICGGNDDVLAAVREHPDRFIGSVYLDPREPGAIGTLHKYADLGFRGAKFHPIAGYWMDDPRYFPLYEELDRLRWPVTIHGGLSNMPYCDGSGRFTESKYADPIRFEALFRPFANVKWIIAHAAWPWHHVAWGLALYNPNVYLDLSAGQAQTIVLGQVEQLGVECTCQESVVKKMIWGSDCIRATELFHQTWERLERMGLGAYMPGIFGETIAKLLGLEP